MPVFGSYVNIIHNMAIVSIHQPAYIPWLGYFHKISQSDIHIFYDDALYSKNNLFNRNKIKNQEEAQWLTIPVTAHLDTPLNKVEMQTSTPWQKKHWKAIVSNYSKAPYFDEYKDFFEPFYHTEYRYLSELTMHMNQSICELLDIPVDFVSSSELNVSGTSNEKLIDMCNAVHADTYLSGKGAIDSDANAHGKPYLDTDMFHKAGIAVEVQQFEYPTYAQMGDSFVPYLSIIDTLFNCGSSIKKYITKQ